MYASVHHGGSPVTSRRIITYFNDYYKRAVVREFLETSQDSSPGGSKEAILIYYVREW